MKTHITIDTMVHSLIVMCFIYFYEMLMRMVSKDLSSIINEFKCINTLTFITMVFLYYPILIPVLHISKVRVICQNYENKESTDLGCIVCVFQIYIQKCMSNVLSNYRL